MSYWESIIIGIIQGLTEFLPVSSSGHLVLAQNLLNMKMPGVVFELILHVGTLLSVIIYFRREIIRLIKAPFNKSAIDDCRMFMYLIYGTIPAVIVAVAFKDAIETAFSSPFVTAVLLTVTGLILLLTALKRRGDKKIDGYNAIIIGIGQALAIFPGISRSGTSISAGIFAGTQPVKAAEFSFLLSIPAILGAIVFKFKDMLAIDYSFWKYYLIGAIFSFIFGLVAVYLLLGIIRKGKFQYFGLYCIVVGLTGMYFFS